MSEFNTCPTVFSKKSDPNFKWSKINNTINTSAKLLKEIERKQTLGYIYIEIHWIIIWKMPISGLPRNRIKKSCYRILSVHAKQHNKWFMTKNKIVWSKFDSKHSLKKCYRSAILIVHEEGLSEFEDSGGCQCCIFQLCSENPNSHFHAIWL